MKILTRLYGHSTKGTFIRRMYSNTNCRARGYLFSPFTASLGSGFIFSIIIKDYIREELVHIKLQNLEIIERLKTLENKENKI